MANRIKEKVEQLVGRNRTISSKYASTSNYIRSKSLEAGIDKIFKTNESADFYLLSSEGLLEQIKADEFSLEVFYHNLDKNKKIIEIVDNNLKSKESSSLTFNQIKKLKEIKEKAKFSTEGMMKAAGTKFKNVFITIKNIIKKLILAIANFFKGIFLKIKTLFSKNKDQSFMDLFNRAFQVAAYEKKLDVQVQHVNGYNKNLGRTLRAVDKDADECIRELEKSVVGYTKSLKEINENALTSFFTSKKNVNKRAITTTQGILSDQSSLLSTKTGTIESKINLLIYGKERTNPGRISAYRFLSSVKSADLVNLNIDVLLQNISSKLTYTNSLLSKIYNLAHPQIKFSGFTSYTTNSKGQRVDGNRLEEISVRVIKEKIQNCITLSKDLIHLYNITCKVIIKSYSEIKNICRIIINSNLRKDSTIEQNTLFGGRRTVINKY